MNPPERLRAGFVRIRCDDCGEERALAFSCKGRGFCPSCTGRRMADTAARLADDVFPLGVPVRQWVLSLPVDLRYRLAYDGKLLSDVLAVFDRAVNAWYRERARAAGHADSRGGSVTFCQRFGSALNLNPHFHKLQLDGTYVHAESADSPLFVPAPELQDADVKRIVETTARRVLRMLERRGILTPGELDPLADESPVLAGVTAASVRGLVATGDRAGKLVRRVLADPAEAASIRRYLEGTGQSAEAPTLAPARAPPQAELDFDDADFADDDYFTDEADQEVCDY
ncbi:MAG: transposase zinc-binding domain-containing protein [Polyangia bacterium]